MAKGRKPSAGIKTGNPKTSKKSTSTKLAPVSDSLACAEPPDDLPPEAADAWRVFLAEMSGNRHAREADLPLLKAYVMAVFEHEEASRSIQEHGAMCKVVKFSPTGEQYEVLEVNKAVKLRHAAATQMRYYSEMLGLSPIARIRQNLAEVAGQSMLLDIRDRLVSDLTGKK